MELHRKEEMVVKVGSLCLHMLRRMFHPSVKAGRRATMDKRTARGSPGNTRLHRITTTTDAQSRAPTEADRTAQKSSVKRVRKTNRGSSRGSSKSGQRSQNQHRAESNLRPRNLKRPPKSFHPSRVRRRRRHLVSLRHAPKVPAELREGKVNAPTMGP